MEAIGSIKSSESQHAVTNQEGGRLPQGKVKFKAAADKPQRIPPQGKPAVDPAKANEEMTKRVAEAMDQYIRSIQSDLEIKIHQETGRIVVRVISHETGEVIREIPSEEMLKLAEKMDEMTGGLLQTTA